MGSRRAALGGLFIAVVVTGCYSGLPASPGELDDDGDDAGSDGAGDEDDQDAGAPGGGGADDAMPGGDDGDADDGGPLPGDDGDGGPALDDDAGGDSADGGVGDDDASSDAGDAGDDASDDGGSTGAGPSDDGDSGGPPDPVCGNGIVEGDEECDDGDADDTDTCSNACEMQIDSDLPDNAYCDTVAGWSEAWSSLELQVITLVNQKRAQVIDCGGGNVLGPAPPVSYDPALTCAARNHSKDMGDNDFFSHTNLQGQGPSQRLAQAGYAWSTWGENIAAGYGTAQQVVDGWIDSQGHCVNLMNPAFTELGVGYYYAAGSDYGHYWTQNFGTPP